MDNLNFLREDELETDFLVGRVWLLSEYISLDLDLKKCGSSVIKKGKICNFERFVLSGEEKMKAVDFDGCK